MTVFEKKVLELTSLIPKGKVTTYKLLAQAIGRPNASRAIANALGKNRSLIVVPCHRVIRSDGQAGGYQKGRAKKIEILSTEGVKIKAGKILDFKKILHKYD